MSRKITFKADVMELRPEVIILRSWIVDLIIGLIYACHDTQVVTITYNYVVILISITAQD